MATRKRWRLVVDGVEFQDVLSWSYNPQDHHFEAELYDRNSPVAFTLTEDGEIQLPVRRLDCWAHGRPDGDTFRVTTGRKQ